MSKIFKCISLVLVLVMMLSMTTFAASISAPAAEANKDARTVKVSGTVSDAAENQQVVILALKSTANLNSVSDADIAYIDQIAADSDGKYEFNFAIDESKGDKFTAYIGGTGVAKPQSASINLGKGGAGDVNDDDVVNVFDYQIVVNAFDSVAGEERYNEQADIADPIGSINVFDYQIVVNNFDNVYK